MVDIVFSNDSKEAEAFDYEGEDFEAMSLAVKYYAWIVDTIKPHLGSHIVEIGAGAGVFSQFLLDRAKPKTLTLVEPSKRNHNKLKQNIASTKKTKVSTINSYLKGNEKALKDKVDTFVYINVLEHVQDDHEEMKRVADTLQKGGKAIIFVPALRGLYSEFDKSIGHYRRYNKKRLKSLAESAGMEVVTIRYMDMIGIFPWWLSMVIMKNKKLKPGLVRLYDTLSVPFIRTLEGIIEAPVGKNVLLVAKKR
ncbi:MAG TPA: methyltransferase domain-containing protein [Patescibacteria group bacterium]|nr:methyltransferase domain-containing protein [Patescibacteria group bacterium]